MEASDTGHNYRPYKKSGTTRFYKLCTGNRWLGYPSNDERIIKCRILSVIWSDI